MVKQENTHQEMELPSILGLRSGGGSPCLPALQTHSLSRSLGLATDFWSAPSLCPSLCWVLGLPRRCSGPAPGQGEETDIVTTQDVLGCREEAQEKGPDSVCVGIRALGEHWIQWISRWIYGALFWRMQKGEDRESPHPLNRKSSRHPRSGWKHGVTPAAGGSRVFTQHHGAQEAGARTAQMHARQELLRLGGRPAPRLVCGSMACQWALVSPWAETCNWGPSQL